MMVMMMTTSKNGSRVGMSFRIRFYYYNLSGTQQNKLYLQ